MAFSAKREARRKCKHSFRVDNESCFSPRVICAVCLWRPTIKQVVRYLNVESPSKDMKQMAFFTTDEQLKITKQLRLERVRENIKAARIDDDIKFAKNIRSLVDKEFDQTKNVTERKKKVVSLEGVTYIYNEGQAQ